MSRSLVFTAFFALVLQSSQAQIFTRGVPASVTSPTADGRTHGVPASVLSPTPLPFGVNPPLRTGDFRVHGPMRRFGNPHGHKPVFIPVPVFYSYYTDPGYSYPSVADPSVPLPDALADPAPAQPTTDSGRPSAEKGDQALQDAYLQGARDALRQEVDRYGEHYLDSRERAPREAPVADRERRSEPNAAPQPPAEDKSPATVFIFKDGHQLETRNYAIMGQTLFDFSGKALKKIQMEEIDAGATAKANDDRGVQVKLQ